jgi:hypothetical protein
MHIEDVAALREYEHLLPPQARELAGVVGLGQTLALVNALGGTSFPVPRRRRDDGRQGKLRYMLLARTVGEEAAQTLTAHYGAMKLYIPNCKGALRKIRNIMMIKEFELRTRSGETATEIIFDLAVRNHLTDRVIWGIVNKMTVEDLSRPQEKAPGNKTG